MEIKIVKPHKFEVGDIFKATNNDPMVIVETASYYHAIGLDGMSRFNDTSIGLLLEHFTEIEYLGRFSW